MTVVTVGPVSVLCEGQEASMTVVTVGPVSSQKLPPLSKRPPPSLTPKFLHRYSSLV